MSQSKLFSETTQEVSSAGLLSKQNSNMIKADLGSGDVHIIDIENDKLSVNGMNILAFSDSLSWDIQMIRSGAVVSGGLFNTILSDSGQVAIVTHGWQLAFSGDGMVLVQPAENMRYGGTSNQTGQEQQQSSPLGGLGRFLG